ncbi:hypothetical protein O181_017761 [Austropuccinia psidii MF-1]|uniref:Reverse transcriptase RNase H-like domain-containing protein n=1 Tax=Austropuccinia psidii MF-1 TaxID=1389203 RepID=A0A9Q3GSA2_9BASI|nr:hypothetical protein [Austropuccinia psidii MF-1]
MLPNFELPFKLYIDSACSQGLRAALNQRQIVDGEPREGVICYISRKLKDSEDRYGATLTECLCLVWALEGLHYYLHTSRWKIDIQEYRGSMKITYKEGKSHTNAYDLSIWPLNNLKRNQDYDPSSSQDSYPFLEIDRRRNFRFSEWAPESGTPDSEDTESEGKKPLILGIGSSELHNELLVQ